MSDPTLSLTFQDMIIRVAEYLGLADYTSGAAAVPAAAHDLDLVQRLVNDGYRKFVNSRPNWNWQTPLITLSLTPAYTGTVTGASGTTFIDTARTEAAGFFTNTWTGYITGGTGAGQTFTISAWNSGTKTFTVPAWTTQPDTTSTYSLTPAQCYFGDNSRYYMPDGFYGSVLMPWTYPTTGPRKAIEEADEGTIRQLRAGGNTSGDPVYIAFRPLSSTVTTNAKRWEAILWPTPSTAYTITSRARLYPDKLVNLTDRQIAGFEFDEAILAAGLSEAERQRDDELDEQEKYYQAALVRAVLIDQSGTARALGDYGDNSDTGTGRFRRPLSYYAVDTYNGSSL